MLRTIAMLVLAIMLSAKATCGESDPRVPPGRDPGGTPIAIVGDGIDYTKEGIAGRLSRDGEGEIIGYDFAEDDRRPFSEEPSDVETVGIVLGEGQATTLIAIRADAANVLTFGKALRFAGQSPAKIVLVAKPHLDGKSVTMLASAAHYFRDRLFIAPAGDEARDLDLVLAQQVRDVPNLLFVAGATADGRLDASANWGATATDIATDGRALANPFAATQPANAPVSSSRAAARIAALAARLLAVEPFIAGAALKARITGLAQPAQGEAEKTRYGFVERPWRHFWLE